MSNRTSKIGQYVIEWDGIYYIAFAGGKRELPEKDMEEYNKTLLLPEQLQRKERIKLGPEKNPYLIPIKGIDLLSIIKEANYMPFFDQFFQFSRTLQVNNQIVYESMKQKSYEIAMGL